MADSNINYRNYRSRTSPSSAQLRRVEDLTPPQQQEDVFERWGEIRQNIVNSKPSDEEWLRIAHNHPIIRQYYIERNRSLEDEIRWQQQRLGFDFRTALANIIAQVSVSRPAGHEFRMQDTFGDEVLTDRTRMY